MKMFVILFAILATTALATEGEKPRATFFAFGGVGFAGAISSGERYFQEILKSEDPAEGFAEWYEKGNNAEKAYCMVGFFYFDRQRYETIKKQYIDKEVTIPEMNGCLVLTLPLQQLIARIETGQYGTHIKHTEPPAKPDEGET